MQITVLILTVLSVSSIVYEIIKADTKSERILKSLTIGCIIALAVLSYFAQQKADKANDQVIALQDERHKQLLGGDNLPTIEFTVLTKQETALNTIPIYYNTDSIEYFVEIDLKLWNESKHYYLKNVECIVTFPNDYLNRKLRRSKNDLFTFEQFQDYYNNETTKTINLGVLPPNVHKHIHRFYLPTIEKEYNVTIDVLWANGFYRGNFILERADPKQMTIPQGFADFVLKLKEPVSYLVTGSVKTKPTYKLVAGVAPPTADEKKVSLKKGKRH